MFALEVAVQVGIELLEGVEFPVALWCSLIAGFGSIF